MIDTMKENRYYDIASHFFPLTGSYCNSYGNEGTIDCIKVDKGELGNSFFRIINKFPVMSDIAVSAWPFSSHFQSCTLNI